jgi:hypothetical protein
MQKPEIDSAVSALCAYVRVSSTNRRLLKRELCTNKCVEKVVSELLNTDEGRTEYDTLFSVVSPREISTVIAESKTLADLKDSIEYYVHGIEILRSVPDAQVEYMTRMFYKLCSIIHPFYFTSKNVVKSPPRRR